MPLPRARRVAVMGFRSVGKSSLTIQFVENQFVDAYDPTIENTFNKSYNVRGQEYDLELIDTAGQDAFSLLPQSYSMNIDGYVLVYSVASRESFEIAKVIHEKLKETTGKARIPMVLVGNKTDLRMERVVTTEEGKRQAEEWKATFLEASAKDNNKVTEIFTSVIIEIEKARGNIKEEGGCCLS